MVSLPTKTEMLERTREHREYRNDSDTVNLLWKGYLTALYEWEMLSEQDYQAVLSELKPVGDTEIQERMFEIPAATLSGESFPSRRAILRTMRASLRRHGNSRTIHMLWRGYLAGMMEWIPLLGVTNYAALDDALSQEGEQERGEVFIGFGGDEDDEDEPQK